MAKVARAKEYIAAGDIFQVVLSQRFEAPFTLPSFALYRALRRVNPSPFLYYLNFGDFAVVGSSPEILVRVRDGKVTIRPIAGTRPRGATPAEDKALAKELLRRRQGAGRAPDAARSRPERRRPRGRVGTVRVTDSFFLEYYSQVMHIVSNVEGKLASSHDAVDALMAGFPAGTVSGAPKVRAMEIIDELEDEARGLYAGCVGYFSADGEMDSCIVLRTSVVKDGVMYVQAGAGVVADSRARARAGRMREQGPRPVQGGRRGRCASPPAPSAASDRDRAAMLTLSLLRHAKSSWKNPRMADRDRPLAMRGVTDAPLMGKRHDRARHRSRPRAVLLGAAHARHAGARAARAQGRAQGRLRGCALSCGAPEHARDVAGVQPGASRVMLVGHNPEIQAFALDLVGSGPEHFRDQARGQISHRRAGVINFASGGLEERHGE